tara:strand:- start:175 stop:375 length:201 start_codon:yes stop_codon:yes gene_type:complete
MTNEETIEYERLKTARDSLLITVARLRGELDIIAAKEREACAKVCEAQDEYGWQQYAAAIRARGEA